MKFYNLISLFIFCFLFGNSLALKYSSSIKTNNSIDIYYKSSVEEKEPKVNKQIESRVKSNTTAKAGAVDSLLIGLKSQLILTGVSYVENYKNPSGNYKKALLYKNTKKFSVIPKDQNYLLKFADYHSIPFRYIKLSSVKKVWDNKIHITEFEAKTETSEKKTLIGIFNDSKSTDHTQSIKKSIENYQSNFKKIRSDLVDISAEVEELNKLSKQKEKAAQVLKKDLEVAKEQTKITQQENIKKLAVLENDLQSVNNDIEEKQILINKEHQSIKSVEGALSDLVDTYNTEDDIENIKNYNKGKFEVKLKALKKEYKDAYVELMGRVADSDKELYEGIFKLIELDEESYDSINEKLSKSKL